MEVRKCRKKHIQTRQSNNNLVIKQSQGFLALPRGL